MTARRKTDEFRVEDRLSHLVAIGAVVATLLAGLVAYLLVEASNDANKAGLQADRLGIRAMGELSAAMSEAEADYQVFVMAEQFHTQEGLARQEMHFAPTRQRHDLARDRWRRLAHTSMAGLGSNAKDLHFGGVHGPEMDATFPEHFLAAQTKDAVRYAALQDAYNERASAFGGKVSKYIAVVTMFGVALYLFALLSVSIQYDVRRLFAIVGAALLFAGSAWAAVVRVEDVHPVRKDAAGAFAAGHVALSSAHVSGAYRRAIDRFDAAIRMRPTYARAYLERATARLLLAASQRSSASVISADEALETTASPHVLAGVTQDLEQAHEHGLASAPVLGRLGHYMSLRGVMRNDDRLVEDGIAYTRQAMEIDPREPVWRLNHALALLALGEHELAMAEYRRGLCTAFLAATSRAGHEEARRIDQPCPDSGTVSGPRTPATRLLQAEALSNLELLATSHRQETRRFVQHAAGMLVASTTERAVIAARPGAQPVPLDLAVDPTAVTVDVGGLGAGRQGPLTVVTSYQHSGRYHAPYVVVPELWRVWSDAPAGTVRLEFRPETKPFRCLPDGRYKVDLFAGGALVGRAVRSVDLGDLHQAAAAPDLDLRACVPDGWEWFNKSLPGLMYGKTNPDSAHGAYLFRFEHHPVHGSQPLRKLARFAVRLVEKKRTRLVSGGVPGGGYFGESLEDGMRLTYRNSDADAEVRVGVDRDRSVVVAVVKGPPGYVGSREALRILRSVGPYYEANATDDSSD
jgi:tetratricopeptide (TPR) repeat protein